MLRGTIEVREFDPDRFVPAAEHGLLTSQNASKQQAAFDALSHLRLRYRTATSLLVALIVVAIHGFVVVDVFRSGRAFSPNRQFGTPQAITALLIDDRSSSSITPPAIAAPALEPVSLNLGDLPDREIADPGLAALRGRYLGDIRARIDRAWLRPRTSIGELVFQCEVQIQQERNGTVASVALQQCNGTQRWQHSLVAGIEAASPLPAPPDPTVFAPRIVLHFRAIAYSPGRPAGEYEPAIRPAPDADRGISEAVTQIRSLRQTSSSSRAHPVIELRISGSRVEARLERQPQ